MRSENMFQDCMIGLDKIVFNGFYTGAVTLVVGEEGTLKSGFTHHLLSRYLSNSSDFGIYLTLEESEISHLRNMKSLRIEKPENMMIMDYHISRKNYENLENVFDILLPLETQLTLYKKQHSNFTCFVLDSLNALYTLIEPENIHTKIFDFFNLLRELNLTSFIIMEAGDYDTSGELGEKFLSDGILELGTQETMEDMIRYVQLRKLRAVNHNMKKFQIIVGNQGLEILEPIYV